MIGSNLFPVKIAFDKDLSASSDGFWIYHPSTYAVELKTLQGAIKDEYGDNVKLVSDNGETYSPHRCFLTQDEAVSKALGCINSEIVSLKDSIARKEKKAASLREWLGATKDVAVAK